jgi:hypothetical protein
MTLYGYVRTKEELLGALGGRALSRVSVPNDPAGHWTEQVREAIRNLHNALQEHPGLVNLLIGQVVTGPTLNHIRNGRPRDRRHRRMAPGGGHTSAARSPRETGMNAGSKPGVVRETP